MNKLFDLNSPVMVFLSRMADMFFLSLLWLVCSLPVITLGPATAALYHVTLRLARKEEVKIAGCFFQGFKNNFKQGVVLNLIFLVVGAVIVADYLFMSMVEGTAASFSSACFFAMGIWLLCIIFYTYPLQAQFYNSIRQTLINAAVLSMRKIVDTVIVFMLNMLPVILACVSFNLFIRTIPVWVLLAPGVVAYLCAKRFVKLFDPYLNPEQKEETLGEYED